MRKVNLDPEHMAFLYEKMNMTVEEITKYLNERGIVTSRGPVEDRIQEYYAKTGREKPRRGLNHEFIPKVDCCRIVRLYRLGYNYKQIEEMLNRENIRITAIRISKIIQNSEEIQNDSERGIIYNIDILKVIEKGRIEGIKAKDIVESLREKDTQMSEYNTVKYLLNNRNKWISLLDRVRLYDDEIKEILTRGMTIEEFVSQYGQQDNEKEIREKFEKLRVVAQYSKRENGEIIQDSEFIRVLDLLEGSKENMNKFNNINSFIVEGKLEKGKINEIKDVIFNGNTDLMVYIFERLRMNLNKGYDEKIFNKSKEEYVSKIDKYLRIMELIDNNIRKTQQKQLPLKSSGDER